MASTKNNFSIQGDDSLQFMTVGSMMRKVKSQTRKKQLYIQLQEDGMNICEQSKKDGKVQSTFSVSDVESVREGHQSEVLQSVAEEFPAEHCFTLVFHGRRGNLDLVAESAGEAQCWIKGLRKLIERLESMGHKEKLDHWIKDLFRKADKNKDGRMNFKEVRDLLKMMNIDMNELHALHLFMMADKSASDTLEDDEFVLFYKMLTDRDDVLQLFRKYSGDGHKLTLCNLEEFLQKEQLETEISRQRILELVNKYEPSETAKSLQAMSIDGFLLYLSSADGLIFNPCQQRIYQDMTQPLCHYFISSSHNTYLLQDQLIGHSSVEGYIRALKRGCRCVELDCWDGSNGEPVVYHGHTFTSKILFKDVIIAVEKYAFTTSKYPVILSIENHCCVEQQRVMAQYLNEILGDKLLNVPLDGKIPDRLPSPQELIGKILIKGKKIGNHSGVAEDSLACEVSDEEEIADNDDEKAQHANSTHHSSKKPKRHLSRQLSDCVVYCKSVPFTSFDNSHLHSKFYEMSSFSESKARKLVRAAGADFVHHNSMFLSRIYPGGLRTDSSNLYPQDMWNVGCQLVALNFQTAGEEMDLNDGLFSQNGCCGYVLKPKFMRSCERRFDPENPQTMEGYQPVSLVIQVISGQQLPKVNNKDYSIIDPLVRVEVHGVPLDHFKQETRHIDNNGFNPQWNDTLQFTLHAPELALVRFVVEDYDMASKNDFIGQYTLPFTCIQQGYRHVPLLSKDGTSLSPSSLFVHVRITKLAGGGMNFNSK